MSSYQFMSIFGDDTFGKLFTNSRIFKALAMKAFEVCDESDTGTISRSELYTGLLIVHLNLAKYAGPAACYPPTRHVCNILFDAADYDRSGGIDRDEFIDILSVLCTQILSKMIVYYIVLIMLVPVLASRVVALTEIPKQSYMEMAANQSTSLALFFLIIPLIWNKIDESSERRLKQQRSLPHLQHHQKKLDRMVRRVSATAHAAGRRHSTKSLSANIPSRTAKTEMSM